MGSMSIWHWLLALAVVVLLFGSGKIKNLFGEFGKGITAFKKGLKEGDEDVKTDVGGGPPPQVTTGPTVSAGGEIKKDAKV
jgi:sec-independent protein translocase protein TatA